MKARISRTIDKSFTKDATCVICGEKGRKNKSLFDVILDCGYHAEVRVCRSCSGEEGTMRSDTIDLPYMDRKHYHLTNNTGKTFWDYASVLGWVKDFIQSPTPVEVEPGSYTIIIPHKQIDFFHCEGSRPKVEQKEG
jgi:hypothetical protein